MTTTTQPTADGIGGADRVPAELLDVKQTARMLNASPRHVYRLADADRMPRPVRLGALVRWRADELRQWIVDGCPRARTVGEGRR